MRGCSGSTVPDRRLEGEPDASEVRFQDRWREGTMNQKYDFKAIEAKGHAKWQEWNLFDTAASPKKKYYMLEMFAYPSGDIHIGHFRNYSIGDVVARYKRMRGYDVLHP